MRLPLLVPLLLLAAAGEPVSEHAIRDVQAATGLDREAAIGRVRFEEAAADLQSRIYSDPAFAGLRIDRGDPPTAVVYFTGNARVRLARYTGDRRFRAVSVALSRVQLEALQQRVMARLGELRIPFQATWTDIDANAVVVSTIEPDRLAEAARNGRIDLAHVRIEPAYGIVARPQAAGPVTAFPQARHPAGARMQALGGGLLALRDGCLRFVGGEDDSGELIVWPSHVRLELDGGEPLLRDLETGRTARIGDRLRVGGGHVDVPRDSAGLTAPIPERCAGPMFVANGLGEPLVESVPLANPPPPH